MLPVFFITGVPTQYWIVLNRLVLIVALFIAQLVGVYISYYWLENIILSTGSLTILPLTIKKVLQWLVVSGRRLKLLRGLMLYVMLAAKESHHKKIETFRPVTLHGVPSKCFFFFSIMAQLHLFSIFLAVYNLRYLL